MRRALAVLGLILVAACSPAPSPSPSPTTPLVTQTVGAVVVTHPADWQLVSGPTPPPGGRAVPAFYLANTPLVVAPCPTLVGDGTYAGCPQPTHQLPSGGVLVTLSPNRGLPELIPPQINMPGLTDACRSIGGERSIESVAAGLVVEACLRGPGLDQSEALVRELIASMKFA